jgi:hypothetical protein
MKRWQYVCTSDGHDGALAVRYVASRRTWDPPATKTRLAGQLMIPVRVTPEFMYLRRPVLVAVNLADLHGPTSGVVELPLHLFWSGADGQFSLDDPSGLRLVYRIVLREARHPDDLATFLNGGMLTALWAGILLPKVVRTAWEDQHPALRPSCGAS